MFSRLKQMVTFWCTLEQHNKDNAKERWLDCYEKRPVLMWKWNMR